MNTIGKFFWKIFSITMVCMYNHNCPAAEDAELCYKSSQQNKGTEEIIICKEGQYLEACDGFKLGLNWLEKTGTQPNQTDTDSEKLDKFRKMFKQTSSYKTARDILLTALCSPVESSNNTKTSYTCTPCPDGGNVKASKVTIIHSTENNKDADYIDCDTWDIHPITDCYVDEFSDSTGTFVYRDMSSNSVADKAQDCFYSDITNVYGSDISNISKVIRYYGVPVSSRK